MFPQTKAKTIKEENIARKKIPLSSTVKIDQQTDKTSKGNFPMYPKAILKPIKYSIPKRQPSTAAGEEKITFNSSSITSSISNEPLSQDQKSNDTILNEEAKATTEAKKKRERKSQNKNESAGKSQSNDVLIKNPKADQEKSSAKKKRGRKRKNVDLDNQTSCQSSNESSKIEDKEESTNTRRKRVTIGSVNEKQFDLFEMPIEKGTEKVVDVSNNKPKRKVNHLSNNCRRSTSVRNPSISICPLQDPNLLLTHTIAFLIKRNKIFTKENSLSRTTSKPINVFNLPKSPFEFAQNLPVQLLTQMNDWKVEAENKKKISFPIRFHSDDEMIDICEAAKTKIKATKNSIVDKRVNEVVDEFSLDFSNKSSITSDFENDKKSAASQNNSICDINEKDSDKNSIESSEKNDEKKIDKKTINKQFIPSSISNLSVNFGELCKLNESNMKLKLKSKPKNSYGETTNADIENYLIHNRTWDNGTKDADTSNCSTKPKVDLKEIPNSAATGAILKKIEVLESNIQSDNDANDANDDNDEGQVHKTERKNLFIPPFFREKKNANQTENEDKSSEKKKPKKKKNLNFLNPEKLREMQDITNSYGIDNEVFQPFLFRSDFSSKNINDFDKYFNDISDLYDSDILPFS